MPAVLALHRNRRRPLVRLVFAVALLAAWTLSLGLAKSVSAHGRSLSYSSFEIDETGANVSLRLPLLELSRLGPEALPPDIFGPGDSRAGLAAEDPTADFFAGELVLAADGAVCGPVLPARRLPDTEGWVRYAWRVECPTAKRALAIRSRVLLDVAPSHLHFARVRFTASPDRIREQVLTEASPVFVVRASPTEVAGDAVGSRFGDYLALGIRHILSGWDHLAFLLGLILLSDRLGAIARLVTGFTLAHSLTLALTVLRLVQPRAAAVEAVIAFSVTLIAIEKGWIVSGRPTGIPLVTLAGLALLALLALAPPALSPSIPLVSLLGLMLFTACYFALAARAAGDGFRIALTFAFGLVHGFGFAGILARLELPTERLVPALLGFNLGVELGQISIVLLVWPALALAARFTTPVWQRSARDLATAGLCGLGCFWLLERAFSL